MPHSLSTALFYQTAEDSFEYLRCAMAEDESAAFKNARMWRDITPIAVINGLSIDDSEKILNCSVDHHWPIVEMIVFLQEFSPVTFDYFKSSTKNLHSTGWLNFMPDYLARLYREGFDIVSTYIGEEWLNAMDKDHNGFIAWSSDRKMNLQSTGKTRKIIPEVGFEVFREDHKKAIDPAAAWKAVQDMCKGS